MSDINITAEQFANLQNIFKKDAKASDVLDLIKDYSDKNKSKDENKIDNITVADKHVN
jgi:hypothetical protein